MSSRHRWDIRNRDHQQSDAITDEEDALYLLNRVDTHSRQLWDIKWLESLLQRGLSEFHKAKVQASLEWLRAVKGRTLGPNHMQSGWRHYFQRLEHVLNEGQYDPTYVPPEGPPSEWAQKKMKERILRSIRREELTTERPDWMSDPSKRPKKPPPGAPQDQE